MILVFADFFAQYFFPDFLFVGRGVPSDIYVSFRVFQQYHFERGEAEEDLLMSSYILIYIFPSESLIFSAFFCAFIFSRKAIFFFRNF